MCEHTLASFSHCPSYGEIAGWLSSVLGEFNMLTSNHSLFIIVVALELWIVNHHVCSLLNKASQVTMWCSVAKLH